MVDETCRSGVVVVYNGRVDGGSVVEVECDSSVSVPVPARAGVLGIDGREGAHVLNGRLRKFTYTNQLKLVLLQSIRQNDAHRAQLGSMDEFF